MTKTRSNKAYTEVEDAFFKACVRLGIEYGLTNSEIARHIHPLLGRSLKGVVLKLGIVKQEVLDEENNRKNHYEEELNEIKNILQDKNEYKKEDKSETIQGQYIPLEKEKIGETVIARVYNVTHYGAFCETEDGKTALIIKSLITTEHVDNVSDYLQVGDVFEALVVEDRHNPDKVLLNAKAIGNIVKISERTLDL